MEHNEPVITPSKSSDLSIPLAIVFSGLVIAGAIIFTDSKNSPQANVGAPVGVETKTAPSFPESVLAIKQDDHVMGNPNADIVLIEYSDAECPFCERFHGTMNMVMKNYSGSIAWVYRHFPLDSIHPDARKAAEGLECASELGGIGAFTALSDLIFTQSSGLPTEENVLTMAGKIGLNKDAFRSCVSSGKYQARVDRDAQEGASIGVEGTPFSLVWNKKTGKQDSINGAQSYATVAATLDKLGATKTKQN